MAAVTALVARIRHQAVRGTFQGDARAFASDRFGPGVTTHYSVQAAVDGAGIICTTTGALQPILERRWVQAGTHINAVGSGSPAARELDGDLLRSARVFVDRTESALREAGAIVLANCDGLFAAGDIAGDVGAVLASRVVGRSRVDEITLFKSVGLAVEHVAAARATCDACRQLGLGRDVPFGRVGRREPRLALRMRPLVPSAASDRGN